MSEQVQRQVKVGHGRMNITAAGAAIPTVEQWTAEQETEPNHLDIQVWDTSDETDRRWVTDDVHGHDHEGPMPDVDYDMDSDIGYTDQEFRVLIRNASGDVLAVSKSFFGKMDPADRDDA